ncbi:hypothetical protein HKX69_28170 [Streptomyces argyrophyllae]|uniref:Uncharacterized protein n=1 Tax=Streptomyces argyrophylli TaxID=2726118 RepID=A0A6M4PP29_9ACTN|nr:hypothetical protein HKX69_28170 [Streptomyces argyrophyllae]
MPRTITGGAPNDRSTAAMPRGALSGDSIVRTERWRPPDRVTRRPGGRSGGRSEPPLVGRTQSGPAGRPPD